MDYKAAIASSGVLEALHAFDPRIVGTLPLDLAVAGSDIDIVCQAADPDAAAEIIWPLYHDCRGFRLYRWTSATRPVVATFEWAAWRFEVFVDPRPLEQQPGWRHFEIERRLLALDDGRLRNAVRRERSRGAKTEPAFAAILALTDNPYESLLELESETDKQLRARIARL
jgi:hypothetical protein